MLTALPRIQDEQVMDVFNAEIPELELITQMVADVKIQMLLPEANEDWIATWERSLGDKAQSSNLEERRRYLIALISSKIKISSQSLEEITRQFTGVDNRVTVDGSVVWVRFLGEIPRTSFQRFTGYLRSLIPAHLGIQLAIEAPLQVPFYIGTYMGIQQSGISFNVKMPQQILCCISSFSGVQHTVVAFK